MRAVFARISAGLLLAGAVVLWLPSAVAQPAPAAKVERAVVHPGDSQAVIIDKLGRPAILQSGNRTFLMYPEGRLILENNRAVEIPPALLAPASTPVPAEVAPSAPSVAATATPVAAAPASPPATAPAKAPAAAAPVAPTKSPAPAVIQPSAAPAETTHSALAWVPMWAWAMVGIIVVFGGLKAWDTLAQRKNTASDSASEEEAKPKGTSNPDLPGQVRLSAPNSSVAPMMEEEPYVAPASPAAEPGRPKITIPLRPVPASPAQTTAVPKPAEPAPAEAPRIVRLSRKPSGPTVEGEGKS